MAGHTFEMTCKVSSQNIKTPRYSVLITAMKSLSDRTRTNGTTRIISLNQDSVVRREDWTDQDRVDGVVLEKIQENEFRYRMYQTQISDAGLYRCEVTAWSPGGGGRWRKAVDGFSNPIQIDFQTSGQYKCQSGEQFGKYACICVYKISTRISPGFYFSTTNGKIENSRRILTQNFGNSFAPEPCHMLLAFWSNLQKYKA